ILVLKCPQTGTPCMLKTGVRDGPNKGKSFYVCVDKEGCDFSQPTSVSPSHCLQHEESVVELQALVYNQEQRSHRLFYRCTEGKKAGRRWCGNVPWSAPEQDKKSPLSYTQQQPSHLPPIRNPFKASGKEDKDAEWRKTQSRGPAAKDEEGRPSAEGRKDCQKENVHVANLGKELDLKSTFPVTFRGKHLPPGIKLKKKVVNEERNSPKTKSEGKLEDRLEHMGDDDHRVPEKAERSISTSSVGGVRADKLSTQDLQKKSDLKKPADDNTSTVVNSLTQASKASGGHTPDPPAQSADSGPHPANRSQRDDDDEDVVLVSVKPAAQKSPATAVQQSLTAFPGFQPASRIKPADDPRGLRRLYTTQLQQVKSTLSVVNVAALPDQGERLRTQVRQLEEALASLSLGQASGPDSQVEMNESGAGPSKKEVNPVNRPGGTIHLPSVPSQQASSSAAGPQMSQGFSQMSGANSQVQAFYGGRMTEDRLLAVKNATGEAIDHLHRSLESCPGAEAEAPDPRGLKVSLLAHQRRALAWLLWRETQKPCGGILDAADDMGLGKTLTMISLILTKKISEKGKDDKKEVKRPEKWISKTDSTLVASKGTLIICPASLVHHWEREISRRVKSSRLSVCLYHGSDRERRAEALADYDVVVTTYSLVSKEMPVPSGEDQVNDTALSASAPLLRVSWDRVVLDEAHNIKNPKAQTSMAVCRLRARARWAVTGTPIQNNLLDMYSLLKFLHCSPFDEFKLWKAQVDNGSRRGRERLNILTRSLLLRRTKDQTDATGKPLVCLPDRKSEVHRLKLSKEEQAVYDVVFAQSRSTLQNYLKRHEGTDVGKGSASSSNPFDKVAQEFGLSQAAAPASSSQPPQPASSTVHILSLLLRLRQCCCHLSLLKKTLDSSELSGDGIVLSLEEQLSALSLTSSPSQPGPDSKDIVALNGTRFPSQLFEETSESTKISAIVSELKMIREKYSDQKSVIVSQWTSMLRIVAVHLRRIGLRYGIIDGTVNPKQRMDLVEEFNTNAKGPQTKVMLVSLCAGGVGLNLIGGNHLFLIDMHWNPALEDQACDRIYRVGQTKDVTIHRFECEGTVEEKISTLQVKKKELAQNVLSGTGKTFTKLSLADLRIIFGV
uniref:Transcription termination factor 2 n=1 Tax=Tetraodon nigroviridis TaxID=99883 RepID=H3DE11_TETNG